MSIVTLLTRAASPMTRADRDAIPDDGYRRELIDGVLLVTPSPAPAHQVVVTELYSVLRATCPDHLRVLVAPLDVALDDSNVLIPDLLVARRESFDRSGLPVAPLLAVEVLSPSTRRFDLGTKRLRYEEAGTPSYWAVDPDVPALTAWELTDAEPLRYAEVAHVVGEQTWQAQRPFPVEVSPARLRD